MKLSRFAFMALATATTLGIFLSAAHAQTTSYYNAGFFDYTVGAGVTTLDVTLAGAFGGSPGGGSGGTGGLMTARLSGLTTGQVLRIVIGSGGSGYTTGPTNGSAGLGFAGGASGGELSAIALGSGTNLSSLSYLLIAGGGGGANGSNGGAGGGLVGGSGDDAFNVGSSALPGQGGTQSAGGAPGGSNATAGSYLQGGSGATAGTVYQATGGGGGGGYYGGGGASGTAGGGGGSSFATSSAVSGIAVADVVNTQGGAVGATFGEEGQTSDGSINGAGYATLTVVNASATAAPEPDSIALLLTAGVPVLGIVRRRKTASKVI